MLNETAESPVFDPCGGKGWVLRLMDAVFHRFGQRVVIIDKIFDWCFVSFSRYGNKEDYLSPRKQGKIHRQLICVASSFNRFRIYSAILWIFPSNINIVSSIPKFPVAIAEFYIFPTFIYQKTAFSFEIIYDTAYWIFWWNLNMISTDLCFYSAYLFPPV